MCAVFNRLGHHEKVMLNLVDALNNVERIAKPGVVGIQLPYAVAGVGVIFLIKRLFTYFCGSAGALRVRGKKDGCRPRVRLNISTANFFSRDMASRGVFRIEYV
jgi:hypothetical protein